MPPFVVTVISRPHGSYGLFMSLFTKIITVFLFVYERFSMRDTVMESESKGFAVFFLRG